VPESAISEHFHQSMTDGKLRLLSTSQAGNVRSEASEHAQKSLIFDDSEH